MRDVIHDQTKTHSRDWGRSHGAGCCAPMPARGQGRQHVLAVRHADDEAGFCIRSVQPVDAAGRPVPQPSRAVSFTLSHRAGGLLPLARGSADSLRRWPVILRFPARGHGFNPWLGVAALRRAASVLGFLAVTDQRRTYTFTDDDDAGTDW